MDAGYIPLSETESLFRSGLGPDKMTALEEGHACPLAQSPPGSLHFLLFPAWPWSHLIQGCKILHLRLSTIFSSCQTTELLLCLMEIKWLVLRLLQFTKMESQRREAIMCDLGWWTWSPVLLIWLQVQGGEAYLHLNSCKGQYLGRMKPHSFRTN